MNAAALTVLLAMAGGLMLSGCSREPQGDLAARVGSAVLTRSDVARAVPGGLSAADSARFVAAYVDAWVDERLIDEVAAANIPDTREIDEMAAEYRRRLIMDEYRRRMMDSRTLPALSPDSVRAYYEARRSSFTAEVPYIKGIFMRLPNSSPALAEARKYFSSSRQSDIEKLEKLDLGEEGVYEYFRDTWTDWRSVAPRIPAELCAEPEAWLRSGRSLADSIGGVTYLLDVTDYILPGGELPFEIAGPMAREQLVGRHRLDIDRELRLDLRKRAEASGSVEVF